MLISLLILTQATSLFAVDGEVTYIGSNTNLIGDDNSAGPFNIGFNFPFYGTDYSTAYANINGTLNFGSGFSEYSNGPLNSSGQNNSIYAFWDDLVTDISPYDQRPIYYATIGTAPERMFVMQWTNMYFFSTTIQMGTFQVILYEATGEIQLQYRDLLGGDRALGNSATVGIKKDNATFEQYSNNVASLTQEQAIRYSPNGTNDYTVNTSAPYELVYLAPEGAPTSPTLVNPSDGTSGVTTTPTFEWLPVDSATSYTLLISTVSNFSSTVVNQSGITGTSYTLGSALSMNTTYYWRVQSVNSVGSSLSPTRTFTTTSSVNIAPNTPSSITSTTLTTGVTIYSISGAQLTANLTDDDTDEQVRYRIQIARDENFTDLVIDYRSEFGNEGVATYSVGQSGGTYLVGSTATTFSDDEYYLRIRTEDDSAASSAWHTETGVAFTKATAPTVISDITVDASSESSIITWSTDDDASSLVQYGLVPAYGFATVESDTSPRLTSHTVTLTNLKACARYYFRVKSKTEADVEAVSNQQTFKTTGCEASSVQEGSEASVSHSTGGEVSFTQNNSTAKLVIPSNFSDDTTSFQINQLDAAQAPTPPANKVLADNNFFSLVAVKSDNTILDTFDTPVSFTISYGSDIESQYQESSLDIYKYTGSGWEPKSCSVDSTANTVTCSLPGFSVYALFGEALTSNTVASSVSSTGSVLGTSSTCNDPAPEYAPDLFQIDVTTNTAKLYFTPILHTNQYFISYSTSDHAEEHGALVSLRSDGVQSFEVRELSPNTKYYFKVRGQRGCTPGPWSSIRAQTTTGVVVNTTGIEVNKQSAIKKETKKLTPTPTSEPESPTQSKKESAQKDNKPDGYLLAIRVLHEGVPLKNAQVELHSEPRYGTTDENGMVRFEGVEKGTHTLYIAQNSYKAQEKITVAGEDTQIDITVHVEMKKSLLPTWIWVSVIGILVLIILVLLKRRR